ncbi:MAG: metal ABC transporter substrate-binding protein [Planctomycetota bacterium]
MKNLIPLLLFLAACGNDAPAPETRDVRVVAAVNYPLAYFAERIAGGAVEVKFLAPADEDPAFWTPDEAALAQYQAADVILLNGATYAKWTLRMSLPEARCVKTFRGEPVKTASKGHAHGPEGKHDHGVTAFTTWLDLQAAAQQARAVHEALGKGDVEPLLQDLAALDKAIEEAAPKVKLLGSHPVYQYLARRYNLDLEAVHFEPDVHPRDKQWAALEQLLKEHPAHWMLWEGEPLPETKVQLAGLGVKCVVFDPCGNRPDEGDFLSVMRKNVERLATIR